MMSAAISYSGLLNTDGLVRLLLAEGNGQVCIVGWIASGPFFLYEREGPVSSTVSSSCS